MIEINPKLSIYIPTFNRVNELVELLNEIIKIRNNYSNLDFEVVVVDNASTDLTSVLVLEALKNGVVDVYVRRKVNRGADVNILDCFKFTSGDFVWTLCDDDLPMLDSVERILQVINACGDDVSLIYLNKSIELMTAEIIVERVSSCEEGVERSLANLLRVPGLELLGASSLVYRRQLRGGLYVNSFGFGNLVAPLCLSLDAISSGPAYLFSQPLVRYREGDKSAWVSRWPEILKVTVPGILKLFMLNNNIAESEVDWSIYE